MIRVPDSECEPMVNHLLEYWKSHQRKYYYGDDDYQRVIETMGVRGEIAFSKHLHALGVEHVYNRHIDKCDFDVYHGGKVYLVDVKTVNVFAKSGAQCQFMFLQRGYKVERMKREGWLIVVAALCGDRVWLSKAKPAAELDWKKPEQRFVKAHREDTPHNLCCRLDAFAWECGDWRNVAAQAREQEP